MYLSMGTCNIKALYNLSTYVLIVYMQRFIWPKYTYVECKLYSYILLFSMY